MRPVDASPVNWGHACVKGRFGWDYVYSKDRLKKPIKRVGEKWVEIEWDDSDDDASGAGDVDYYLLEKKRTAASAWTSMASVPATRSASYRWSEMNPVDTGSFDFGVRAVDCGGAISSRATKSAVTLP